MRLQDDFYLFMLRRELLAELVDPEQSFLVKIDNQIPYYFLVLSICYTTQTLCSTNHYSSGTSVIFINNINILFL